MTDNKEDYWFIKDTPSPIWITRNPESIPPDRHKRSVYLDLYTYNQSRAFLLTVISSTKFCSNLFKALSVVLPRPPSLWRLLSKLLAGEHWPRPVILRHAPLLLLKRGLLLLEGGLLLRTRLELTRHVLHGGWHPGLHIILHARLHKAPLHGVHSLGPEIGGAAHCGLLPIKAGGRWRGLGPIGLSLAHWEGALLQERALLRLQVLLVQHLLLIRLLVLGL